jgi:3-deoxy-7-phosphoheptulonate synthase
VTEVMDPTLVPMVCQYADVLQIGARNMQNFTLLNAAGESQHPVLLKRGMSSTMEDLLMAAEYVLSHGNTRVMLCERGIRTFEKYTRNTFDLNAIPVLKKLTHLPVIADPSHAVGYREYVPGVALGAVAAGADGVIVEVHPNPEEAMSDGRQTLTVETFKQMMEQVRAVAQAVGRDA